MNNVVIFDYNNCKVDINFDKKVKEKILINNQINNYQTSLLEEKIHKLYDSFLHEMMTEELRQKIKFEVDKICELYLLNQLKHEEV